MTESYPQKRPVISVTVRPKFHDDWDKLQRALSVLTQQDQGMRTATQDAERWVTISGMGELHMLRFEGLVIVRPCAVDIGGT